MGQQLGLMRSYGAALQTPGRRSYMKSILVEPWLQAPPPPPTTNTVSAAVPPTVPPTEDRPKTLSLRQGLLHGYRPDIRTNGSGREANAALTLAPHQKICYYPGKLHGGYQAFLMDQLFADCCSPALTANLSIDYMRPIVPETTLLLDVWPAKIEGRKIFMEGSIMVPEETTGEMVPAAKAKALFILPKNKVV
ncbi:HotDog domain-containing protein [Penicillium alfredii]|uniref:HotDog domain-containing protein n=1 Tax=Penicillium alfredii TaxID=1506179 RepID=A0A9W9FSD9_9EURO|nr:HotDog domain-containing protein [Penicillium alfredii]KAJ5105535.1 HotDog domain-containing protein [Penicillium alfredii]